MPRWLVFAPVLREGAYVTEQIDTIDEAADLRTAEFIARLRRYRPSGVLVQSALSARVSPVGTAGTRAQRTPPAVYDKHGCRVNGVPR